MLAVAFACMSLDVLACGSPPVHVLGEDLVRAHVERFNRDDVELYANAIPNARALGFLLTEVPRFECPDEDITRTYWFRWWTYRKHLRCKDGAWAVSEYLPDVPWSGAGNTIVCPLVHHLREGRWLRNPVFMEDYLSLVLAKGNVTGPKAYASPPAWSALELARTTGRDEFPIRLLQAFVRNYETWEKGWDVRGLSLRDLKTATHYKGPTVKAGYRADRGLFDYVGDREGSEFALSLDGARPMVNSMMWAEATAIAEIARMKGDAALKDRFAAKAAALEKNIKAKLWNPSRAFFTSISVAGQHDDVCELHGYAPFYFGMRLDGFGAAWRGVLDEQGFCGPKGLTFPRRDTPGFRAEIPPGWHACMWNGPSWPYATSIALTALYRTLQAGTDSVARPGDFVRLLHQYAAQQVLVREDGKTVPWIDESLSAFTGEWVTRKLLLGEKRFPERGKDYNHSTFCDLVIAGLCGFVPQTDGTFAVKPLAPAEWDWWCVDGIRFRGRNVTVLFDRDGRRYGKGRGLVVLDP